jgi:hypothetical protein
MAMATTNANAIAPAMIHNVGFDRRFLLELRRG